jgi:hypothetical protein
MQDESSDKDLPTSNPWPMSTRLAMLGLNFIPVIHIVGIITLTAMTTGWWKIASLLGSLYVLPALVGRIILWIRPISGGTYKMGTSQFLTWWATAQCQMIFCRLPFLEETLRLVPGIYSLWLRLWGAKIGRLTFWSPGLKILDRSFLKVGDDVVFGAGARLNAHVLTEQDEEQVLQLSQIVIGDRTLIGGYSLLTAGTVIEPDQTLKAFSLSQPFSQWTKGRRSGGAIPR